MAHGSSLLPRIALGWQEPPHLEMPWKYPRLILAYFLPRLYPALLRPYRFFWESTPSVNHLDTNACLSLCLLRKPNFTRFISSWFKDLAGSYLFSEWRGCSLFHVVLKFNLNVFLRTIAASLVLMTINFVRNILDWNFGLKPTVGCILGELGISKELYLSWAYHTMTHCLYSSFLRHKKASCAQEPVF